MSASFSSVSGVLSKQSLFSKDNVVCFFIKNNPKHLRELLNGTYKANGCDGGEYFYHLINLPVFGTLCDYATLKDIEKSPVTEHLEEYFDNSIENILKYIQSRDKNFSDIQLKNKEKLENVSLCFERRDIYEKMIKIDLEYRHNSKAGTITSHVLEHLGFKLEKTIPNERFCMVYRHEDHDGIEILCDGSFSRIYKNGIKEKGNFFNPESLISYLGLKNSLLDDFTLYDDITKDYEEALNNVFSVEDSEEKNEILKELFSIEDSDDYDKKSKLLEKLQKMEKEESEGRTSEEIKKNNEYQSTIDHFSNYTIMAEKEPVYVDRKLLSELMAFSSAMVQTNSLYMPTMSGHNDEVPSYFGHLVEHLKETKR